MFGIWWDREIITTATLLILRLRFTGDIKKDVTISLTEAVLISLSSLTVLYVTLVKLILGRNRASWKRALVFKLQGGPIMPWLSISWKNPCLVYDEQYVTILSTEYIQVDDRLLYIMTLNKGSVDKPLFYRNCTLTWNRWLSKSWVHGY